MNPLMTEEKVIELIEEVGKPDNWPYNEHYFWWSYKKPLALYIYVGRRRILSIYPNDVETFSSAMLDLAMHHYISNVKKYGGGYMQLNFKECRGNRTPNFGYATIEALMGIMQRKDMWPATSEAASQSPSV